MKACCWDAVFVEERFRVLDREEGELGIEHFAIFADQIDADAVLEKRDLVAEDDRGIAAIADHQIAAGDTVHVRVGDRAPFGEVRARGDLRRRSVRHW